MKYKLEVEIWPGDLDNKQIFQMADDLLCFEGCEELTDKQKLEIIKRTIWASPELSEALPWGCFN